MKRTLYLKLLVSYVIFAAISMIILTLFTQNMMIHNERKAEAESLRLEATRISNVYASRAFADLDEAYNIQKELEVLSSYNESDILLVKPTGEILMRSDAVASLFHALNREFDRIEGFNINDFHNQSYMIGDFYGMYDSDQLIVFSTVTRSFQTIGYVILVRDCEKITLSTNAYMSAVFFSIGLVFAASFIVLIFFSFLVYRPLRRITTAATFYAQGDFTQKIKVNQNDEMGYLANTLNYMADALDTQEEEQRKFISNVSHDFRSPLTSIKGYCEAMIDGTIPVEMQERYLNIILSETERLNKLTQSLLDLNQFGKHDIRLDLADFDINQMIKNVLLTFEGVCYEKHIVIDLVLVGEELFVTGDMTKIGQVLYNLVDNAIKFSHHDSTIKIETTIKKDRVFVSVKDHGIGIPADSVKKIWERFYKTDASRGRDKRGVGLGLAIVKEIITAHQQNIDCISTEGAGTEFVFTLALAERSL